jgi:hypothetical protein
MTVDTPEIIDQSELLAQFRTRYETLVRENETLKAKIRENEVTALKLAGAIETLEYLNPTAVTDSTEDQSTEESENEES